MKNITPPLEYYKLMRQSHVLFEICTALRLKAVAVSRAHTNKTPNNSPDTLSSTMSRLQYFLPTGTVIKCRGGLEMEYQHWQWGSMTSGDVNDDTAWFTFGMGPCHDATPLEYDPNLTWRIARPLPINSTQTKEAS